jgi:hypothetical protein
MTLNDPGKVCGFCKVEDAKMVLLLAFVVRAFLLLTGRASDCSTWSFRDPLKLEMEALPVYKNCTGYCKAQGSRDSRPSK